MADFMTAYFGALPDYTGLKVTKTYRSAPTATVDPTKNTLPQGYVVVVTGGAQGIGRYIARSYVLAKASAVVITARRAATLEQTKAELEKLAADNGHTVKISTLSGDAEKYETSVQLRELLQTEHGGRLDALVCNAGPGKNSEEAWSPKIPNTPVDAWQSVTGVNYNGPFYAAKELISLLLKSEGKTLINVISAAAHMLSGPPPAYCLAKFAATRLTQQIGETYADEGLVAVALHPGAVQTPGASEQLPKDMQTVLVDDIALAGSISVWLTKNRPAWLSGRYLSVNWDVDELLAQKDEVVAKDKFKFRMVV